MTKTYLLEEAKEMVKNGKAQIQNDNNDLQTLNKVANGKNLEGNYDYYTWTNNCRKTPFPDLEIIPLSSIQDIKWGDEVQGSDGTHWSAIVKYVGLKPVKTHLPYITTDSQGCLTSWRHIRKPEPNLKFLTEKLQSQLDQELKGYTVVIQKEK